MNNTDSTREMRRTSRKRKLDDEQNTQYVYRSCIRNWNTRTNGSAHISVNGLDISLNSTTYYECVSITSSKNGATVITNVSCSGTYTPPAKRAKYDTAPRPIMKHRSIKKPTPVKKANVSKGASRDKKDNSAAKEVDECLICQQGYRKSDEKKFLPCAHYFHNNCVNKWLRANNSCPVCRTIPLDATYPSTLADNVPSEETVISVETVPSADNVPSVETVISAETVSPVASANSVASVISVASFSSFASSSLVSFVSSFASISSVSCVSSFASSSSVSYVPSAAFLSTNACVSCLTAPTKARIVTMPICDNCIKWNYCNECYNSANCVSCTVCFNCSRCIDCNKCYICTNCSNCSECYNCS